MVGTSSKGFLTATEIIAMEGDVEGAEGDVGDTMFRLKTLNNGFRQPRASRLQTNDHRIVPRKMNFVQLATKSVQR